MAEYTTDEVEKRCSKCGEVKPLGEFKPDGRASDGCAAQCRACARVAARCYRERNRTRARASARRWARDNRDKMRQYYLDNHEAILDQQRAYHQAHRAERRAAQREYGARPGVRQRQRERAHAWYEVHRKATIRRTADWKAANPERNAELQHASDHRRRARLAGVEHEEFARAEIWARDGGLCHLCGQPCDAAAWHLDHIVPIARGGAHVRLNVAVSHPVCNLRKNATGNAQLRLLGGNE